MLEQIPCALAGVFGLRPIVRNDARGDFAKLFQAEWFAEHNMPAHFAEHYVTRSEKNVIRGLHFQTPPHDHCKLVTCLEGDVFDVVVDLRRASPTYGQHAVFYLNGVRRDQVFIPTGFAHGFCALTNNAVLHYAVGTAHAPAHDAGIRWDSAEIDWPAAHPVMSERDKTFPPLAEFKSCF